MDHTPNSALAIAFEDAPNFLCIGKVTLVIVDHCGVLFLFGSVGG
jgi:hypothetical protein